MSAPSRWRNASANRSKEKPAFWNTTSRYTGSTAKPGFPPTDLRRSPQPLTQIRLSKDRVENIRESNDRTAAFFRRRQSQLIPRNHVACRAVLFGNGRMNQSKVNLAFIVIVNRTTFSIHNSAEQGV